MRAARSLRTRVALVQRRQLDLDGLHKLFSSDRRFDISAATTSLLELQAQSPLQSSAICILDAISGTSDIDIFGVGKRIIDNGLARHILFLDDFPNRVRARRALMTLGAGYVTRQSGYHRLASAALGIVAGKQIVDGFDSERIDGNGHAERHLRVDHPQLRRLTQREIEVMQLLAEGRSVRQCADILHLATSTVDNHKSRLMKKLGLSKGVELAYIAIRTGLIAP